MRACTHRGGAHWQRVNTSFWLGKTLTNLSCAQDGTLYQLSHHVPPIIKSNKKYIISHHLHHMRSKGHIKTPSFIQTIKLQTKKQCTYFLSNNYNSKSTKKLQSCKDVCFLPIAKSKGMSLNNVLNVWAVKCCSLMSIKSEQKNNICSIVSNSSHGIHTGGSSPLNKKERVIYECPICNREITVSSRLLLRWGETHSFNFGKVLYN